MRDTFLAILKYLVLVAAFIVVVAVVVYAIACLLLYFMSLPGDSYA